ncbi:fumarylacetoacetase [Flavobacterium columnare]|uniref:fumarylacetoacetase n=2 Tax=Flavobacterium columnare TaxID=996 RepID=G8XAA8_FLACA|nr:fumarylacetoacetase [Flavobacterium columnare]AEW85966.1 fumarylacetoacetase [Flavobacterium columnare ATCC 49512]AMO19803.1 fumarylacetoacetase [Flavobacterium columnare]AUX17734.1 fumarylacetoacetase [Flavobacterium columnare]MEB3800593.1 fumarylacetoacetase [Flavobacterium columnare]PDS24005.1 fumarylacetoacetase [Flavobacterium columnare] [Flavobacterium columnare NBRC 100251 = ATCC 23463]
MPITANNPERRSWLEVSSTSDFPIQNIPFGVFLTKDDIVTVGTRIGDYAIDLGALHQLGYFEGIDLTDDVFLQDVLNEFISCGKKTWRLVRNRIADIFDAENADLRDNAKHREVVIFKIEDVEMQLPVFVGDYTDFFSSREHATNTGKMFRDPANALLPNWLHIPVGYHGRSSTIVPSGIPVHRPMGQTMPPDATAPVFGPSRLVDFELETAFITTDANLMGENIPVAEAEDYIFGMVLLNDWSARDIQKWEYVPLGPFLAKNFASSISPWIVTMDALEPFRCASPVQEPTPLPYLQQTGEHAFDIKLQVSITPEDSEETIISNTNFKYMYWTMNQQLAHHTINGCRINSGDMMGSGTISGPTQDSLGSMLELTWGGKNPILLKDGSERKFINDGDTVIMRGYCQNEQIRIGFGEVSSKLLPPIATK